MKRLITMLVACLLLGNMALSGFAEEIAETVQETTQETVSRPANACGENLTWNYASGKLTITGSGDMDDCSAGAPWDAYADSIYILELSGGVTSIGAGAFAGYANLTDIDFGGALREIGENAFRGCKSIATISLPKTFRLFGSSCFQDCTNLMEVHCAGGMPSFRSNCLWNGSHITVFCPDDNVWALKYVQELETNFGGRLEVLTEGGKDVYAWPEETTEPTQAPTEAATQPTQAPTEAPTVPTEAVTMPAVTAPATTAPEEAVETVPPQPSETQTEAETRREPISGILVGTFLLSGTLSLLLIGMLIFKGSQRGGKYGK